jgi:hypothetical protein
MVASGDITEGSDIDIAGTPGELYEQHIVPAVTTHWTPDFVELMRLRFGESVLDVACGTGVGHARTPVSCG